MPVLHKLFNAVTDVTDTAELNRTELELELSMTCPSCFASPGELCVFSPFGTVRKTHNARLVNADVQPPEHPNRHFWIDYAIAVGIAVVIIAVILLIGFVLS